MLVVLVMMVTSVSDSLYPAPCFEECSPPRLDSLDITQLHHPFLPCESSNDQRPGTLEKMAISKNDYYHQFKVLCGIMCSQSGAGIVILGEGRRGKERRGGEGSEEERSGVEWRGVEKGVG